MRVKYEAGPRAKTVPNVGRVERGKPVTVSSEQGKRLAAQGWQEVREAKPEAKPKPTSAPSTTTKTEE